MAVDREYFWLKNKKDDFLEEGARWKIMYF